MNKEILSARLQQLHRNKAQLDTVAEQSVRQSCTVVGQINEINHWLSEIAEQEAADAQKQEEVAAKTIKEAQAKSKKKKAVKKPEATKAPAKGADAQAAA